MKYLQSLSSFLGSKNIFSDSFAVSLLFFCLIGFLLLIGRKINLAIKIERFGLPIAVICGLVGILIGPYGVFNLFTEENTKIWERSLTPLLSLVFASLMLGRPIPNIKGLIKPILNQFLLAISLGFGQFFVGGLVVKYFLEPSMDVNPLMGCLIEVGFEGGHGAATILGNSFEKLGFSEGLDLGLAMATMGLLSSSLLGSLFVFCGKVLRFSNSTENFQEENKFVNQFSLNLFDDFKALAINFGLVGIAIFIGIFLARIVNFISIFFGEFSRDVIQSLPVFPLILIGSLLVRYVLEKTKNVDFISQIFQRELGILSTDLLIFASMASLNVNIILVNLKPIILLTTFGLIWNIICISIFVFFVFEEYWFEKSLAEFGNSTGVVASGLLLLRLSDPKNISKTLPIFTSKQLFAQLLLSGGFFTVLSPFLLQKVGLLYWTELCALLTFLIIGLAILLNNKIFDFN
tara:strand:- start:611 stop:1996 length:1386 start_codon:yes stop_codon:yes gene_type:complete